ncbi:hypothetical protein AOLI_G00037910 [Acnodon oligacanthus]
MSAADEVEASTLNLQTHLDETDPANDQPLAEIETFKKDSPENETKKDQQKKKTRRGTREEKQVTPSNEEESLLPGTVKAVLIKLVLICYRSSYRRSQWRKVEA